MKAALEATLVVAACAVLYLAGTADVPFYTRGEPREGLVVREMLRSGAWLVPARPAGEPARKPPLYYWAAAAALTALPTQPERALRLPSALLGSAAVLGTWATARAACGPAAALPAALIVATSFEWVRAATSARVDMTLAASLAALLAGWTLALVRGQRGWLALAVAGAVCGTLAKGPVALVLPALAAFVLRLAGRDAGAQRLLRPALVVGLAAGIAGVWYAAALARTGSAFLDVVARENWLRFVDPEEAGTGHAHAAGYLVPLGLVGLLPWTPLFPLVLAPLGAGRPPERLWAAWVVTGLVFFSLAAAKRSVYLLPLYPALALLAGAGAAAPPPDGRLARAARAGAALYAPVLLALAAVAGAFAAGLDPGALARPWLRPVDAAGAATLAAAAHRAASPLALLALVTAATAPLVARAARRARWRALVVTVAGLAVLWIAAFDTLLHPTIARARSMRAFLQTAVPPEGPLFALFPPDPGLRFYAPPSLAPWPVRGAERGGHLLLWEDERERLRDGRGHELAVLATSEATQPGRGHLLLVAAPRGPLVAVKKPREPRSPPE